MNEQMEKTEALPGGFITASVQRTGNRVTRTAPPRAADVHRLLAHLAQHAPGVAPTPLGLDPGTGTETLTFIEGDVPTGGASPPYLWSNETLSAVAHLVRTIHDATTDFVKSTDSTWHCDVTADIPTEVVCHNDLAPWNTVFRHGRPVAFIDWDLAAPGPREWDIAYALWHFVPLYGSADSDPFDTSVLEPRAERAKAFCDAYGMTDRSGIVDAVVRRQESVYQTYRARAAAGDEAYQRLWRMGAGDGVRRQIAFVERHARALRNALER